VKYCLALGSHKLCTQTLNEEQYPHLLNSFAYARNIEKLDYKPDFFIVDSGAFSAWNIGKSVDIHEYARYAKEIAKHYPRTVSINLDVIPGAPGAMPSHDEVKDAMDGSIRNADFLRVLGLEVMEVFHQGEPLEFLDFLLARMPRGSILCIAPRNDISVKAKVAWLTEVLRHLLKTRTPQELPKFHGLACTSPDLMRAFPFYSVDSSTWINPTRFGAYLNEAGRSVPISRYLPSSRPQIAQQAALRRSVRNSRKIEAEITLLWKNRGIVWTD
jgi:hypothetical protein